MASTRKERLGWIGRAPLALLAALGTAASAARADLADANLRLAQGEPAQLDRQLAVLSIAESAQGVDLNGDGDADDASVVHVFDAETEQVRNLGLATRDSLNVTLRDRVVVFLVEESAQGRDLNGDGDALDAVLHVLDGPRAAPVNFRLALGTQVLAIARDGRRFAALVRESAQAATDLNGDGDTDDLVLNVVDLVTATPTLVPLAVTSIPVIGGSGAGLPGPGLGGAFSFGVNEAAQGHTDLNGDGDSDDNVSYAARLADRDRDRMLDFARP